LQVGVRQQHGCVEGRHLWRGDTHPQKAAFEVTVQGAQKGIGVRFIDGLVFLALGIIGCRWQPGEERGAVITTQVQRRRTEHNDGRPFGPRTEQHGEGAEEEVISEPTVEKKPQWSTAVMAPLS
jgi:hypothetical protein